MQEPRQLSLQVAALLQTCEVALQLALRVRKKRCDSAAEPCSKVEASHEQRPSRASMRGLGLTNGWS